ncbi:hypothetical protein [Prosthecomicrobium sp. N25]|uniref:hypothetical protein n=1 Tax=Prosthecomicrobium sp. N25 TaxID=3129254 RepID=UPI003078212B
MPGTLTKRDFGKRIGVSPTRMTQLVAEGLPIEPDGRVDPDKGERWVRENLDGHRRAAAKPGAPADLGGTASQVRMAKMFREAKLLDLELKRREGELISREEVERQVFGRARFERDAWTGWANRAAVAVSAETGSDPARTFAVLDRLVRDHLDELARTPLEYCCNENRRGRYVR